MQYVLVIAGTLGSLYAAFRIAKKNFTPLPLADGWQLQASIVDFHHLINRHAWRTSKSLCLV